ncbi:hypothetical protein CR513_52792, partial [Mucuna pruriens]
MTAKTKIDMHAGTLSMEFGDTLVQFNIFEAMKNPVEDTSLFGIDLIDELVKEHMQAKIDRVSPTSLCLSYFRLKLDWFPVSRDQIAESRSALASLRPSRVVKATLFSYNPPPLMLDML